MADTTHLDALELRLSNERQRLAKTRSKSERALREVWCIGIEVEIRNERKFLGLPDNLAEIEALSDDDLLAELQA